MLRNHPIEGQVHQCQNPVCTETTRSCTLYAAFAFDIFVKGRDMVGSSLVCTACSRNTDFLPAGVANVHGVTPSYALQGFGGIQCLNLSRSQHSPLIRHVLNACLRDSRSPLLPQARALRAGQRHCQQVAPDPIRGDAEQIVATRSEPTSLDSLYSTSERQVTPSHCFQNGNEQLFIYIFP
jgi:hypothetical protein